MIIRYSVPVFTSKPNRSILFPTQHHSASALPAVKAVLSPDSSLSIPV